MKAVITKRAYCKAVITKRTYCVEVSIVDMQDILDYDNFSGATKDWTDFESEMYRPDRDTLLDRLDKTPSVLNVEYDGHFGAAVFFEVFSEDDKPSVRAAALQVIQSYISEAQEFFKTNGRTP